MKTNDHHTNKINPKKCNNNKNSKSNALAEFLLR